MEEKVRREGPWATEGRGFLQKYICSSLAFPPAISPFPSPCPWWSLSPLPSPEHTPFPSCSGVVLSERGTNGGFWSGAPYAIRLQHLESWKGSTWERVPEKTNFRSRLVWEKAHVHGGGFRDLVRGLAPAFNGSDVEPSRAHDAAWPSREISLTSYDTSFIGLRVVRSLGNHQLLSFCLCPN